MEGETMEWEEVSGEARKTMNRLGFFQPTLNVADRTVKGYARWGDEEAGKVYLDSENLREIARHVVEVADWLDKRASTACAHKFTWQLGENGKRCELCGVAEHASAAPDMLDELQQWHDLLRRAQS